MVVSQFNNAQLNSLLTDPNQSLGPCLVNCTNNGVCTANEALKFVCVCKENFTGVFCNMDTRPCSSTICMKNGTCTDVVNSTGSFVDFNCSCIYPNYGRNCQLAIDLCANITCSNHGACKVNGSQTSCSCFSGFEGADCSVISKTYQAIKKTISATSIIACFCIGGFYSLILLSDLMELCRKNKKRVENPKLVITKAKYVPMKGDATRFVRFDLNKHK